MADRDLVAEFESFTAVLNGCASHLSEEGIFLETTQTGEVGSEMAFEVRIRDGFSVLRGEGEIVQATDEGLYLRLAYLDQPSLKLLPRILEHYARVGVPQLELPVVEAVEVEVDVEDRVAEEPDIAEESVDDGGGSEEETQAGETAMGLTLDDLEAEFLMDEDSVDDEVEDPADAEPEAGFDGGEESSALLVDAEDLTADSPASQQEESGPDDIHLDELLTGDEASDLEAAGDSEVDALQVDPGLPWLPDEPEKQGSRSLWMTLLLVALAAALGAAFYYYIVRPRAASSWRPSEPVEVQARALPAATIVPEPVPITNALSDSPAGDETETVPDSDLSSDPVPETPRPRSPDPPTNPLTGVNRITWVNESGETVITFWGDGLFVADQVDDFRVDGGAPREVIRIRGIRRPFAQQQIELDTVHVRRIRVGLHQEADGAALHFVADLVDGDVELLRTEAAGAQLRVYFSKAG